MRLSQNCIHLRFALMYDTLLNRQNFRHSLLQRRHQPSTEIHSKAIHDSSWNLIGTVISKKLEGYLVKFWDSNPTFGHDVSFVIVIELSYYSIHALLRPGRNVFSFMMTQRFLEDRCAAQLTCQFVFHSYGYRLKEDPEGGSCR